MRKGQRNDQSDGTPPAQAQISHRTRLERIIQDQGQDTKARYEEGPQGITELGRDQTIVGRAARDLKLTQSQKE